VSFVLARIAEDERVALSSMHRSAGSTRGLSTRGLREAAFKRRLVDDALRASISTLHRVKMATSTRSSPFLGSWPWSTPIIPISMLAG
jgi:hypothetical protein